MNSKIKRAIDFAQLRLIELSAPTLKREYVPTPVRPPVRPSAPATVTFGELLALKGVTI